MTPTLAPPELTNTAPARSNAQRLDALAKANVIRSERATLKRDVKAAKVELRDLVNDPPEWLLTAKVFELLLAIPKVGRVKAHKVIARNRISPSKTFGGLSGRQRYELTLALAPHNLFPSWPH